jgi:hypothetical protein
MTGTATGASGAGTGLAVLEEIQLYRAWQRTLRQGVRTATTPSIPGALRTVFPDRRRL